MFFKYCHAISLQKTVSILVERYLRKHLKASIVTSQHFQSSKNEVIAEFDERVQDFISKLKQKDSPRKMPSFEVGGSVQISFYN